MTSEVQPPAAIPNTNDVLMSNVQGVPQLEIPDTQQFATMFAELMGANSIPLFNSHILPELETSNQLDLCASLAQPGGYNLQTSGAAGETRLKEMQATIDVQSRQLLELQSLVRRLQEQSAFYREKAVTFKALYNQQQGLSERIMAALIQLRHRQEPSGGLGHKSLNSRRV
ncbi:hypothetical protein BKA70DRAFT_1428496 [Coprinopsis sp. MPI-PUGE-AT-0042]|nr:hypothetical protein BKA70DRAFT_1428496 [Coprinopsis sp. MPI-PUGE-AT-0042]